MTVKDLLELLANFDPDAEVVLATQAHYPLEHALAGVVSRRAALAADRADDEDDVEDARRDDARIGDAGDPVVLLVEGTHIGYGIRGAWDAVRA